MMSTSSIPVTHERTHVAGSSSQQTKASGSAKTEPNRRPILHSFCSPTADVLHIPERPTRKVSFSDFTIPGERLDDNREHSGSGEPASDTSLLETGPRIAVYPIDSLDEELMQGSPLVGTTLPVFVVKLGMLKQATVYRVEFVVPDSLPHGELELLRCIDESSNIPAEVGANCSLLSCDPNTSGNGHKVGVELRTTKCPRVNEYFTLRLIDRPAVGVHLILHGLSLGRGQGTPFLRLGIHRVSENPDYDDSDEQTEWPGFVPAVDEEEEVDDEQKQLKQAYQESNEVGSPKSPSGN